MPHRPRAVSASGFYHVTARGNAKSIIFENDDQRNFFLQLLERYRDELGFRVIAWCLMDNHVHIILDAYSVDLSLIMHHIMTSYAKYFNRSEERVGHVFQTPFRSVPIESDAQLINTVRYIHMNPVRAGICGMDEYEWSSYKEYALGPRIADVGVVIDMAGGKEAFLRDAIDPTHVAMFRVTGKAKSDDELIEIVKNSIGWDKNALLHMQAANKADRAKIVWLLKLYGASSEQIGRLCGIGARSVTRIVSAMRKQRAGENAPMTVRRIVVVPHNDNWSRQFEAYKECLTRALGAVRLEVHHIGSTAVEGLAAKPTIDILVTVGDLEDVDAKERSLLEEGFSLQGEHGIPGRRYLVKYEGANEVAHVHVFSCDDTHNIVRHLAVREYLRRNPTAAEEYGMLKMSLARQYPYDPDAYWKAKSPFVQSLEKKALAFYADLAETPQGPIGQMAKTPQGPFGQHEGGTADNG